MKKKSITLMLLLSVCVLFCFALWGCGNGEEEPKEASSEPETQQETPKDAAEEPNTKEPADQNTGSDSSKVVLYIGDQTAGFQEYPVTLSGEMTPEALIEAMSDLTGWDLTLADQVTSGPGGMTVSFSDSCALFTGPPEPQKDEFHVFDVVSLSRMVLDSIQKTLQENYVQDPGDPSTLDIYYSLNGDDPLALPDCGITIPLEEPYHWPE